MDDTAYIVTLASGGSVRVTPTQLEIQPGQADLASDITDLRIVKDVARQGNEVIVRRVRRRTMQITLPNPEDAAALETHIRAALGIVPAAPIAHAVGKAALWLPLAMLACAVLVVAGSLGPWVHAREGAIYGSERDGYLTAIFGFMAGALAGQLLWQPWRRGWTLGLPVIAFALSTMIGVNEWVDIVRVIDDTGIEANIGWGLSLMTLASAVGVVLAFAQYRYGFRLARASGDASAPVDGAAGAAADGGEER